MEKKFYFGKIAYTGKTKSESVEVTIRYEKKEKGYVFSATGDIWNCNHSDIYCGGQCLDTIAEYVDNPVFKEIHELWKLYHLNDMHAECVHQAELGWRELAMRYVAVNDKFGKVKNELLGWLRESEHPEGLLCRPCPVCGYKYGTSWNFFEIPDVDKQKIERLMSAETPSIQYRR